jgi:hypothetical protein
MSIGRKAAGRVPAAVAGGRVDTGRLPGHDEGCNPSLVPPRSRPCHSRDCLPSCLPSSRPSPTPSTAAPPAGRRPLRQGPPHRHRLVPRRWHHRRRPGAATAGRRRDTRPAPAPCTLAARSRLDLDQRRVTDPPLALPLRTASALPLHGLLVRRAWLSPPPDAARGSAGASANASTPTPQRGPAAAPCSRTVKSHTK